MGLSEVVVLAVSLPPLCHLYLCYRCLCLCLLCCFIRPKVIQKENALPLVILLMVQYPRPVHLAAHRPVPLLLVQVLQPVMIPMVHCPQPALQLILPVPLHLLPLLMPLRPLAECDGGYGATVRMYPRSGWPETEHTL